MSSATVVFLFDTTHHVLWAEELSIQAGIPAEVVPAPPGRDAARCDLALETFEARARDLAEVLNREGVVFYPADGPAEKPGDGPADGPPYTSTAPG